MLIIPFYFFQPITSRTSISAPRPSLSLTGPSLPTGDPSADPASAQAEEQILKAASLIASDLSRVHKEISAFWGERIHGLLQQTLGLEEVQRIQSEWISSRMTDDETPLISTYSPLISNSRPLTILAILPL